MSAIMTAWLLTIALHGGALIACAWGVDRALRGTGGLRAGAWRESLWRAALCGGVLTATLQIAAGLPSPAARWQFVPAQSVVATVATTAAQPANSASQPSAQVSTDKQIEQRKAAATSPQSASEQPQPSKMSTAIGKLAQSSAWTTWIVCAWLAGALVALARVLRSWLALRRALAAAITMDES